MLYVVLAKDSTLLFSELFLTQLRSETHLDMACHQVLYDKVI